MQAANIVHLNMNPAGPCPESMWESIRNNVPGTLPARMLRAVLVSE